jgi:hypothetical protein
VALGVVQNEKTPENPGFLGCKLAFQGCALPTELSVRSFFQLFESLFGFSLFSTITFTFDHRCGCNSSRCSVFLSFRLHPLNPYNEEGQGGRNVVAMHTANYGIGAFAISEGNSITPPPSDKLAKPWPDFPLFPHCLCVPCSCSASMLAHVERGGNRRKAWRVCRTGQQR